MTRKRVVSSLLVLVLVSLSYTAWGVYGEIQPDGTYSIQGLWHMESASTPETDSSGNGNDCTYSSGGTATGKIGQAIYLDADTELDCGTASNIVDLPTTYSFSVSFWAKKTTSGSNTAAIVWSGTDDLLIYPYDDSLGDGVRVFWRDVGETMINENGASRHGTTWHWFVFTSSASNDHKIYVDTILEGSSSKTGSAGPFTTFQIGHFDNAQNFLGWVDEVVLYDNPLSIAEMTRIYAMQKGHYGTISYLDQMPPADRIDAAPRTLLSWDFETPWGLKVAV